MPSVPGTLNFPTSLDDSDSLVKYNNNASSTLSSGINASVLLIPVTTPSKFSSSGIVTIVDSLSNPTTIEVVLYTSKSGSDLVVPVGGRGAQSTVASSFLAGAVVEQRATAGGFKVLADAIIALQTKLGITSDTPGGSNQIFQSGSSGQSTWESLAFVINALGGLFTLDVSGTNQAGNNLILAGGKGTGNAAPGRLAAKFPLVGASGTTLQSLSSSIFPLSMNMFTGASKTIANTTTETTLFGTGSADSTLTIPAGMARVGQIYRITIPVFFTTTGTPTGRLKIKLGSTTIADSAAQSFLTAGLQSRGWINCDLSVTAIGSSGSVTAEPLSLVFSEKASGSGGVTVQAPMTMLSAGGSQTVDLTAAQALDVTWTWGTANASNSIVALSQSVDIIR